MKLKLNESEAKLLHLILLCSEIPNHVLDSGDGRFSNELFLGDIKHRLSNKIYDKYVDKT